MTYLGVSEVARRIGTNPRHISDLFYRRDLCDGLCPIVVGRRLIPESYIPVIEAALRRHGRPLGLGNQGLETKGHQSQEGDGCG